MTQLPNISNTTSDNNEINNTFKLLEEGEKKIELSKQHKNVTLVLGNTGSGKSTFIQWIAGDNSKLISKEVEEGTGDFIIEDGNNRIGSSSNSKTTFPELVVDRKTNAAYYDCPGFSDTRSTSYDIASTYFIKKLADHASNVKIVLVVGYPSVRKGVDRQDFIELMRHTTDLIKGIRKFDNSIAIVITKVDNTLIKKGKHYSLVPDENIIGAIANFLQTVKKDLNDKSKLTDIVSKEKTFFNNAIKLVDILCTKNNKNYTRIGIFRRPDESGPLRNIQLLQKGKEQIEQILYERLNFTAKSKGDFGYTISERSKNDINGLVEKINEKVWSDVKKIVENVQKYYSEFVKQISVKINSFVASTAIVSARETEAHAFSTQLGKGYNIIPSLIEEVQHLTDIEELSSKTNRSLNRLGVHTCTGNIRNILLQGKYFKFLQTVSDRTLNTRPWISLLKPVETSILNSKKEIKRDIQQAAKEIDRKVNHHIESIAVRIEEYFRRKMDALEIENITAEINKARNVLLRLVEKIKDLSTAQELAKNISKSIIKLDISTSEVQGSMLNVMNYGRYLEFLKILNDEGLDIESSKWVIPFNKVVKHLAEEKKWYQFLGDLYIKFSNHEIQENINKFNVANIDYWGHSGNSQGIQIDKNTFNKFLEKIEQYGITKYTSVKNMQVNEIQLRELNQVLSLTLRHRINPRCLDKQLVIQGDYIKLSDFISANGKLADWCRSGVNLSSVNIFALNTVFIDRDFQAIGDELQVSVIAPKWQIVGARKISLDGANGGTLPQAQGGHYPGSKGHDGDPGLPGGAAGNFLGIGEAFSNSRSLTITVNGGQGGPGQTGGTGAEGPRGETARTEIDGDGGDFKYKYLRDDKAIALVYNSITDQYIIYGKPGGRGGNGGLGGREGKIVILKLKEISGGPATSSSPGSVGIGGRGGHGGLGGLKGNDIHATYCKKNALFYSQHEWCGSSIISTSEERAAVGFNGRDGHSTSGTQQPGKEAKAFQSIAGILNDYKSYLRENLRDRFKRHSLMQFVRPLDGHVDIKDSYNTLGLVDELQRLEEQVNNLHGLDNGKIIYFYQSILNRTNEYAQHPKNIESSNQYKKVLGYLYTATLSKIYNLKSDSEPDLIIDIDQYLDLVRQNINSLKNLHEKSNKASVIDQYRKNYESAINVKVREAVGFIEGQITPEIDNINLQIDNKVDLLINETIILQKQARKERDKLTHKKRELESQLITSWIFSGVKLLVQVIGCLGNLGSVVGSLIESGNQMVESLVLDDEGQITTLQLPESVSSNIQLIKTKIIKLKQKKKIHFNTSVASLIDKGVKVSQWSKVGINIYQKYENDKKKLGVIDDAIEQAKHKIQKLARYEEQIHETIIPVLENTENNLHYIASQLNNKSQVALDITQWQVQSALRDMRLQMHQLTQGFNVEGNLTRCIEKLEEVMSTLIKVYDRIQNYQDQKQLADYLAAISSSTANNIEMTNEKLGKVVNDLEITIRSNLVFEQYKSAVNSLKQQVFPLAHLYLKESMLPSYLESGTNLQNLVDQAIKQIGTIQFKITEYKTHITNHDSYMNSGWFSRDSKSSQPFFVWKNKRHRDMISKLLAGGKVVVTASILNSLPDKEAIKFNIIGINFHSSNSSISSGIRDILKEVTVSATHLGNSYYKFNNNIYVITGGSQNIQFSFEKDAHGEPLLKNNVYDKIKSGNLILSPYAMWEIQLMNPKNKTFFRKLKIYKDKVDIELVGYGSYLTKGANISNIEIEHYYQADDTLSAIYHDKQLESPMEEVNQVMDEPLKKAAHRRTRRQVPDISSSASRPTPWITRLWQGLRGILADTNPRLPQTPYSPVIADYTAHHLQGGLQLLDLVIRKWTGKKYSPPALTQNVDDQPRTAAAELAYAAYCPRLPKLQQSLTAEIHESHAITPQEPWLAYPLPTTDTHNLTRQLT